MTTDTLEIPLARSRAESIARFEHLLEQYSSLLRRVIRRNCPPSLGIQTSDVEQEAHLRLWQALERQTELAEPAAYIYRIAVSTTVDAVRRVLARREEQLSESDSDMEGNRELASLPVMATDPSGAPDAIAERRQLMTSIGTALSSIPPNRRRAVELHLQGLSLEEIAQLVGWTEPKARNLVYRGLGSLRDALRARGIEYASS